MLFRWDTRTPRRAYTAAQGCEFYCTSLAACSPRRLKAYFEEGPTAGIYLRNLVGKEEDYEIWAGLRGKTCSIVVLL